MPLADQNQNRSGDFQSPGGFVFGVQGWTWGEQRPTSITFFLDGRVRICDQHGRPIKGSVKDGKVTYFDRCTHAEAIEALEGERVDWLKMSRAGWPQLAYDVLKALPPDVLPPTPVEELEKITDKELRQDALRVRREVDEAREKARGQARAGG